MQRVVRAQRDTKCEKPKEIQSAVELPNSTHRPVVFARLCPDACIKTKLETEIVHVVSQGFHAARKLLRLALEPPILIARVVCPAIVQIDLG